MVQKKHAIAVAAAVAILGNPLVAEEATVKLSEVTVTSAAGFEQKITDAPASISVITSEELQKKPYTNLLDAVRDIEGVDVGETRDKTGQGSISIRGMGGDYTLVLIDGRRQNNVGDIYPNSFGGNQQNHIPPLDMVERIEVIRGPMATLYGSDAMGGVINIITKKVTGEWTGSITTSQTFQENKDFGDDRTTDIVLMGPLIENKLGLALRGSLYKKEPSSPRYAPVTDPAGVVHERTTGFGGGGKTVDSQNWSAGAKLSWLPTDNQEIIFDYDISRQKYDNSENQLGTQDELSAIWRAGNVTTYNPDLTVAGTTRRVLPRVGYFEDQRFERDQYALSHIGHWDFGKSDIGLSYVKTSNLGRSMPFSVDERKALQNLWDAACVAGGGAANCANANMADLTPAQMAELESFLPRQRRTMETRQLTFDAKMDIPLGDHLLIVGGQYIDAEHEDGVFSLSGGAYDKVQPHKQWALFAEDNYMMTDSFTLTGGVRYDNHQKFGSNVSPRLYGVYHLNADWTIKGGVATGYKAPKTDLLYPGIRGFGGQGTGPWIGNPDLKPEKSVSKEIAVYYSHPERHNFNVTVFHNDFKDKIVSGDYVYNANVGDWADLGYTRWTQNYNLDKAVTRGVEIAGRYYILKNLSVRASYTYTDSEQKGGAQDGRPLNQTAEHMYNATLDWGITEKWNTFLTLSGEKDRYNQWDTTNNKPIYYKDYHVLHMGGSYKVAKNITINARINNLLDKDFTTYQTTFTDDGSGGYTASYLDDYNLKAKSREFWVSVNATF